MTSAQPPATTRPPLRIGVVGLGMIGEVHARTASGLSPEAVLTVVADVDSARAETIAGQLGTAWENSLEAVCARADVDLVSVCLPSGTHATNAIQAMRAGKHVMIEKPIDITLEHADAIIDVEAETGRVATVVSQRRFQGAPSFLRTAVESGHLGRITSGVAVSPFWREQSYFDGGGWRGTQQLDGGGALMNQGIHTLDLMLWLMGDPVEVMAYSGLLAHQEIEVEDTAGAVIRFANGAIGTVLATTAAFPDLPVQLSVHGDGGSAVLDGDRVRYFHSRILEDSATRDADRTDQTDRLLPDRGVTDLDSALRLQYLDLLSAVRDGHPPLITTRDARRSLAAVLAIYESARTGRPAVVR